MMGAYFLFFTTGCLFGFIVTRHFFMAYLLMHPEYRRDAEIAAECGDSIEEECAYWHEYTKKRITNAFVRRNLKPPEWR